MPYSGDTPFVYNGDDTTRCTPDDDCCDCCKCDCHKPANVYTPFTPWAAPPTWMDHQTWITAVPDAV